MLSQGQNFILAAVSINKMVFYLSSQYPELLILPPLSDKPCFLLVEMCKDDFVADLKNALLWQESDKESTEAIKKSLDKAKNNGLIEDWELIYIDKIIKLNSRQKTNH